MIHTQNLSVTWPHTRQAHGAKPQTLVFPNIDLPPASLLCLRGPSGSGKSTWLALVAGLLSPNTGQVCVLGQSLEHLTQAQRDTWRAQHIGFMPQAGYLCQAFNVQDNLRLVHFASGRVPQAQPMQRLLESLEIAGLLKQAVSSLSQGQRLRVALARALLNQPQLLLVDEPTANLDDDLAQSTLQLLLAQTQAYGCGLVLTTHDPRATAVLQQHQAHTLWLGSTT